MTRRNYILWAIPLFTLLSCGATFVNMMGSTAALILGLLLALPAWGLVWARLYASGRLRPEFALLAVLPQIFFFLLMFSEQARTDGTLTAPLWQNIYFLLTLAAIAVQIVSLRPGPQDEQRRPAQDPPFIFLTILIIANGILSWVQYASVMFSIN